MASLYSSHLADGVNAITGLAYRRSPGAQEARRMPSGPCVDVEATSTQHRTAVDLQHRVSKDCRPAHIDVVTGVTGGTVRPEDTETWHWPRPIRRRPG